MTQPVVRQYRLKHGHDISGIHIATHEDSLATALLWRPLGCVFHQTFCKFRRLTLPGPLWPGYFRWLVRGYWPADPYRWRDLRWRIRTSFWGPPGRFGCEVKHQGILWPPEDGSFPVAWCMWIHRQFKPKVRR